MALGQWIVSIALITRSNFGLVTSNMQRQAAGAERNVNALRNRVEGLSSSAEVTKSALTGVGIAAAAAFAVGIKGAADLETAMVSIRNATGATQGQMEMLRETAFDVSAATAQSVVQSAHVMAVMATSGINDPEKLRQIARPAAMFADVQFLSRGVPFEQGAKQAIQLAHLFQRYTPQQVEPIYDKLTKLSQMMPDTLDRFLTQAGYYMPAFRRLGVDDDQALVAGAFLDRMGLGRGKGGTGLQNFVMQQMQGFALTKHQMETRGKALQDLGLVNADMTSKFYRVGADGKPHFDVFGALGAIDQSVTERTRGLHGHALEKRSQQLITEIQKALNVQGGRIGFLGTPESLAMLHQMLRDLDRVPGMYEQQNRYMNTLNGRWQLFRTNVSSFLTELMWPMLGGLRDTFKYLADQAHWLQQWLHQNKESGSWIALQVSALAGLGIVLGGIKFLGFTRAIAGIPLAVNATALSLDRLTAAISRTGVASTAAATEMTAVGTAAGVIAKAGAAAEVTLLGAALSALGPIIGALTWWFYAKKWHGSSPAGNLGMSETQYQQYVEPRALPRHIFDKFGDLQVGGGWVTPDGKVVPLNKATPTRDGRFVPVLGDGRPQSHLQRPVRHAGGGGTVHVHGFTINYHEGDGRAETPAGRRERNHKVRELAASVFRAAADVARTSSRAMAGGIHLAGMSPLELGGEAYS